MRMNSKNHSAMSRTLITLLIAACFAPQAMAGKSVEMPKDLPAYAADKPLPVPEIAQTKLDNGLTVWVVPRAGVPLVDYVLVVKGAGLAADDAGMPGFANTLASMLSEGTEQRGSKAIAEMAQGYGGSVRAIASTDGLTLVASAMTSKAEPMLALLGEIAQSANFPEKEVTLAKANALQGLKAAEAQPGFRAERAVLAAVYGDHPYARTQPTEAGINAITRNKLLAAYKARLRPDQSLLVITGRIDKDTAVAWAKSVFEGWKASGDQPAVVKATPSKMQPSLVYLERSGSVQSALRVGRPSVPATHADYIPLRLTSTILGGGFSSRLTQNLREDKGYTYGAFLGYRAQVVGGALIANADVRNEVTGAAVDEFFAEYARIGSEPVSASELQMHQRFIAGGYLISNQQQAAVASTLANNWLIGLPPEFLGDFVPKIRQVDAEQVQATGKKYFDPKAQSVVVVGDKAVVDQLKKFGMFKDLN